jgi:hypothetical protein
MDRAGTGALECDKLCGSPTRQRMSDALFNPAKAALKHRGEGMIEQADYRIGIEERAGSACVAVARP